MEARSIHTLAINSSKSWMCIYTCALSTYIAINIFINCILISSCIFPKSQRGSWTVKEKLAFTFKSKPLHHKAKIQPLIFNFAQRNYLKINWQHHTGTGFPLQSFRDSLFFYPLFLGKEARDQRKEGKHQPLWYHHHYQTATLTAFLDTLYHIRLSPLLPDKRQ